MGLNLALDGSNNRWRSWFTVWKEEKEKNGLGLGGEKGSEREKSHVGRAGRQAGGGGYDHSGLAGLAGQNGRMGTGALGRRAQPSPCQAETCPVPDTSNTYGVPRRSQVWVRTLLSLEPGQTHGTCSS